MLRSVEGVVGRGVGWFSIFGEVSCLGSWVGWLGIEVVGGEEVERKGKGWGGEGFLKRPGVNVNNT